MNGVIGVISSVSQPVIVLTGEHVGEQVYTYTIEFMDGGAEIVYEFDLAPIPGSARLRYTGTRTPPAPAPPAPGAAAESPNAPAPAGLEGNEDAEAAAAEAVVEAAAEAAKPKLELANGPVLQFYHKSAAKDDFGIKLKHWRRYLSPYAPFTFHDLEDPSIEYSSLEAAWYGAMIGIASNKPGLRGPMFSVESNTYQTAAAERGEEAFNPEQIDSYVEEGKKYYGLVDTAAKLKRTGIEINKELWNERKEQVLIDLLKQRYDRDPVFKQIIDSIRSKKARVYFYSISGKDSDLSGSVASGSTEINGENLLGRAIMYLAGLTY
jgi:hypothetical protein